MDAWTERRRFPRYLWSVPAKLKRADQVILAGNLLNVGRGGAMVEVEEALRPGDFLRIRIEGGGGERLDTVVMLAEAIWSLRGRGRSIRHGLTFLRGQDESYRRLRCFREVAQAQALAETLGVRFIDLVPSMIEKRALGYVSRDLAFHLNCVPVKLRGRRLMVAMAEPGNAQAREKLRLFSQCAILPVGATPTAIRTALHACWGRRFVSAGMESRWSTDVGPSRRRGRPRTVAIISSAPDLSADCMARNLLPVLNRSGKEALVLDVHSSRLDPMGDTPRGSREKEAEWIFVPLPLGPASRHLEWAFRADETILVVSPSYWEEGCLYVEAAFDHLARFDRPLPSFFGGRPVRKRCWAVSIVCAQISSPREGFRLFDQVDRRLHGMLDMKEPHLDIEVNYLGGVVADPRGFRKAEKTGVPVTVLSPKSVASQCLIHLAHSLLQPVPTRDPRLRLGRSLLSRVFFLGRY